MRRGMRTRKRRHRHRRAKMTEEIQYTESQIRRAALEKHVAAFMRCGGVVQHIPEGATGYDPRGKATPFVINMNAAPPKPHKQVKQNWKEYTHGK